MICVEDIGYLLPSHKSGKIVGIASHRGDYIIVACEHGLYRLYEDFATQQMHVESMPSPDGARRP